MNYAISVFVWDAMRDRFLSLYPTCLLGDILQTLTLGVQRWLPKLTFWISWFFPFGLRRERSVER
jgi:hypothetical protein